MSIVAYYIKKPTTRRRCLASIVMLAVGLVLAALPRLAVAEDWPAYRADPARSGRSANGLKPPLTLLWRYDPAQAPRPAWPESQRIRFDWGHQPVMAGGLVLFGSTVDDTVRALDAATGELKWTFATDGPVRFAPHVADHLVYVASDDGYLYCLYLTSGKLKWRFGAGLRDDRVIGNGRMISRWPLRTGVLVDRGVAYITAGLWPSEGVSGGVGQGAGHPDGSGLARAVRPRRGQAS